MWSAAILTVFAACNAQFFQEHFFSVDPPGSPIAWSERINQMQQRFDLQMATLSRRVDKLEQMISGLQKSVHSDWNSTSNGAMFKVFSERKSWEDAEDHCRSLNSHLAVIDSDAKNSYVTSLVKENPTADFVWIGMKTKTSSSNAYSNFAEDSPIDGCAVLDSAGLWAIRSCSQLRPFVCQMVISK